MSPRSITRTVTITLGQIAYEACAESRAPTFHELHAAQAKSWEAAAEAVAVAVEQDIVTRLAQALGVPAADLDSLLKAAADAAAKARLTQDLIDSAPGKAKPARPDPIPWERLRPYLPTEPGLPWIIPPASPAPYVPTRTAPNSDPWPRPLEITCDEPWILVNPRAPMPWRAPVAPPYDDSHHAGIEDVIAVNEIGKRFDHEARAKVSAATNHPTFIPSDS